MPFSMSVRLTVFPATVIYTLMKAGKGTFVSHLDSTVHHCGDPEQVSLSTCGSAQHFPPHRLP